jgi:arylsulfatase A-like enzyme/Tfp pilus assembly protein PilF
VKGWPRLAAVLMAGATLAVIIAGAGTRFAPRDVRRESGLNVLLVTIDTLRADALGAYGDSRAETPWIDRLARGGVRFARAHAHNVVTLPSHSNILSGRHPFAHGVRDNAGFRFPRGTETLATILKRNGYRTAAFVSAFTLDSRFGLDAGFDVYDDAFAERDTPTAFALPERSGVETVAAARRWLAEAGPGPYFCWVHLYDPHAPYEPPEPFASRFPDDPYRGEVAAADAALGALVEGALEAGKDGRTLVVLTCDHGESLGEHGERTHGIFAYEATLHVPLIVFAPRLLEPRVVEDEVGHVDVLPTVLDALGLPPPAGLRGRSLLPLADGRSARRSPTYFEALSGQTTRGWAPLHGVTAGGWKYVDLPLPELYDLGADPREERNLVATRPAELERLRAALSAFPAAEGGAVRSGEDREVRDKLRALGYLSLSAPAGKRYTADDDPKRLIDLDASIETVIARHRAGDVAGALTLCEEVVARRPDMPAALLQLALLRRKAGRLGPAVEALRRAVAISPEDEGTAALLGSYLNEAGQAAETVRLLEPYANRADAGLDTLVARGAALAQLGRAREARASFDRAVAADPSRALTLVQRATVEMMARDDAAARADLEAALARDDGLALAHHTLGLLAGRRGDDAEAERRFRRALDLDAGNYDAMLNLGSLLARRGRRAEAQPYLERFAAGAPPSLYAREIARARTWLGATSVRQPDTAPRAND